MTPARIGESGSVVVDSPCPVRPCPVCAAVKRELLFTQRFEALAGVSLMQGYEVVVCRVCGFVFADRIPSERKFERYYADASKYEFSHQGGQQHDAEVRRLRALASWIAERIPASARLMDAGCATGELLVALREHGFSDLTGLDLSEASARYAREHHGLHVIRGTLGEEPRDVRGFDVVVLSAVLEHIPVPHRFLEQLQAWLAAGTGLIIVEVPDAENFARAFNAPYQEFSIEHINFFSASSLDNLMGAHGYSRVAVRQELCYAGPNLTGPVLTMIFRSGASRVAPAREASSEAGVRAYLERCRKRTEAEDRIIAELVETQRPVIVWGTGTLCQRLLATTSLRNANIRAFIDSNPHYQGQSMIGRPVLGPRELMGRPEPILISSWVFVDEITRQIREDLGLDNEIIRINTDA